MCATCECAICETAGDGVITSCSVFSLNSVSENNSGGLQKSTLDSLFGEIGVFFGIFSVPVKKQPTQFCFFTEAENILNSSEKNKIECFVFSLKLRIFSAAVKKQN